jgi:hypothetical protein
LPQHLAENKQSRLLRCEPRRRSFLRAAQIFGCLVAGRGLNTRVHVRIAREVFHSAIQENGHVLFAGKTLAGTRARSTQNAAGRESGGEPRRACAVILIRRKPSVQDKA